MNSSSSRENILKKIREALTQTTPLPFPQSEGNTTVFHTPQDDLEMVFATQFANLAGKFVFCIDSTELVTQLSALCNGMAWTKLYCRDHELRDTLQKGGIQTNANDLAGCDAAITTCEALVARTGSIVLSAGQESGRLTSVYAPVHICVAYTGQLVFDIRDAFQLLKKKYGANLPSLITFATGPSRTADIEKTLVVGVHGPREVFCFLVES